MIELFNSRKMVLLVISLVCLCVVIIILEGLFTEDHVLHPLYQPRNQQQQHSSPEAHQWQQPKPAAESNLVQPPPLSGQAIKDNHSDTLTISNLTHQQTENRQQLPTTDFCWLHEPHVLVDPCAICDKKARSSSSLSSSVCAHTGYKERIRCQRSGMVERSCVYLMPVNSHFAWFHALAAFCSVIGLIAYRTRRKQLDQKILERFRRQLQSGV